jgi:hypothetical protein
MTIVPSELYRALLNFGVEHDEAVELCQGVSTEYAERAGPTLFAMSKRFKRQMEDIERRLTALERRDWKP